MNEKLEKSDFWRRNEAFHVLARCYLASSETALAKQISEKAVNGYLNLGLYNRINQVEQSMYMSQISIVKELLNEELRYEFRNVGL